MHTAKLALGFFMALLAIGATAAEKAVDHAAMGHTGAVVDGPWSYKNRNNPQPYKQGRWEMVPVPQYGHMFLNTEKLDGELRCAAVRDNPGVMVDRATRKACGMPELPPSVANPPAGKRADHAAMGHK
ncbi:MAG: hypothetical protein A2W18_06410 [Candidatus Muproteobacteria bacterium RBG_16_60_9]|uniref:Uncharacterized protein n=1 Tax=Candidatus Muproteobacteria bacterium RBG_16_60_9 TaxID=1817755 RepID=A0A1F6V0L7_9PROT|nr:MAG: hypothetical protein A2W18_06410 [Candidatus Muproteobacteria bacterium RBG_16_60_9]